MTYTHDFRVVSYLDEVKLETEVSDALNMGYEIQNAQVIQIAEGILHTVYLTKKEKKHNHEFNFRGINLELEKDE